MTDEQHSTSKTIAKGGRMKGQPVSNRIGYRYGRLVVLGMAPKEIWRNKNAHWICECLCGQQRIISGSDLESGNVNSCGCLKKEKIRNRSIVHGNSGHPLYGIWQGIINRCTNPRMPGFNNYGGRGIKVCKRWFDSFDAFVQDMGPRPSDNHSVDRIDNDGDYSPSNCRWASSSKQALNKNRRVIRQAGFFFLEVA